MESWKGNRTPSNPQEGYYVGLMNACGYRTKDLEKPVIGIVNSFTDVNPGHRAFKELVGYVKEGVWAAGGTPAEFNVPAPCDGMAQGEGMHFILPSRDLIAGSIEAMVSAHGFDGLGVPLHLRQDRARYADGCRSAQQALYVPHGGQYAALRGGRGHLCHARPQGIHRSARNIDNISEETFTRYRENICFSCGTCSDVRHRQHHGRIRRGHRPVSHRQHDHALLLRPPSTSRRGTSASASSQLTKEGVRFSDIVTEASLKNGLRHVAATGGSTNAQLHICALARVMGIPTGHRGL